MKKEYMAHNHVHMAHALPSTKKKKVISAFSLAMLNVSIMASLRNLPLVAAYGYGAIAYFIIVGILFLIPLALISAELATGWSKAGGIYIWVREAFGDRWGFFAIWMQWAHNITWYPAILSFVTATFTYVIYPELTDNRYFTLIIVLIAFWGITYLNFLGIRTSSLFSTIGVILGTVIPGCFLICLATFWIFFGYTVHIHFELKALLPHPKHINDLVFLGGMFLAFSGLEVTAGYANEIQNPKRSFPIAIILASGITFFLFMLGALSIGITMPPEQVKLVSGLIEALEILLHKFHITFLIFPLALLLIFGAIAEVNSWIIGPVRALHETSLHGNLPPLFKKVNNKGVPINLLLLQAIIVTISSFIFVMMPSVNSSYWILSAASTQMYVIMYIFLFLSGIRLRYKSPSVARTYKVPFGIIGMWIFGVMGILSSLCALFLLFIPPTLVQTGSLWKYEAFLIITLLTMASPPLIMHLHKKPTWK